MVADLSVRLPEERQAMKFWVLDLRTFLLLCSLVFVDLYIRSSRVDVCVYRDYGCCLLSCYAASVFSAELRKRTAIVKIFIFERSKVLERPEF